MRILKSNGSISTSTFFSAIMPREWALNGHDEGFFNYLKMFFEFLSTYLPKGAYMELGCGTGLLCKYVETYSKKQIIPFGVDLNHKLVRLAKRNNPKYAKNFQVADYFTLPIEKLAKFTSVAVFIDNMQSWGKTCMMICSLLKKRENKVIVLHCYEFRFLPISCYILDPIASIAEKNHYHVFVFDRFVVLTKNSRIFRHYNRMKFFEY
ncbi:MAG: methyltransferase domain-containing protein [Candidatus Omnitrophota bacterium]